MAEALQLPDTVEPDWSRHWSVGVYIQLGLSIACHLFAAVCWFAPTYRPIAPLLHLAAFGLLLDLPNRLRFIMLQRAMNFRRLRIVHALGAFFSISITLALGLAGWGAYAIVLGANVISALPFTIDLLLVQRWRPRDGWWSRPDWEAYRPSMRLGLQQASSGLLHRAHGALAATVLPGVLGFTAMGLWDRAQGLYNTTVGRLWALLVESVYPLLPRYAADPDHCARRATLFGQVILWITVPGAIYLGLEGISLSRLLYGEKWIGADSLIWPAAIAGLGLSIFGVASTILFAANRLRTCLYLDILAACLSVPLVAVAWTEGGLYAYAWAIAAGYILAGGIALNTASSLLVVNWLRITLVPPAVSTLLASLSVLLLKRYSVNRPLLMDLSLSTVLYALVIVVALRGLFPEVLRVALFRMPGGPRLKMWLRLSSPSVDMP